MTIGLGVLFIIVGVLAPFLLLYWVYDDLRTALDDHRAQEFLRNHRR